MPTPEEPARINIHTQLEASGWTVQLRNEMNLYAARGVAVREFPLQTGEADYLLFVDCKAVGVVEAKPEGVTLSGVVVESPRTLFEGRTPALPGTARQGRCARRPSRPGGLPARTGCKCRDPVREQGGVVPTGCYAMRADIVPERSEWDAVRAAFARVPRSVAE